jgi:hypothetical protein
VVEKRPSLSCRSAEMNALGGALGSLDASGLDYASMQAVLAALTAANSIGAVPQLPVGDAGDLGDDGLDEDGNDSTKGPWTPEVSTSCSRGIACHGPGPQTAAHVKCAGGRAAEEASGQARCKELVLDGQVYSRAHGEELPLEVRGRWSGVG